MDEKRDQIHVELAAADTVDETNSPREIELLDGKTTYLIPRPSADPNDPLNLPSWRKWAIVLLVSTFSCTAVVMATGMGPIFSMILAYYPGQELRANDLMTYPTLFMGIGNLLTMPLALTIGRRPIFLGSMLIMIAGGIWCACSKSLESHIAGRAVMSLAAGQSEALAPMIVQEIFFLHERGRMLAWFIFIQNVGAGVFFVTSTYMTSSWGWRWWYGFFTIATALAFVVSVFLATETMYHRSQEPLTLEASGADDSEHKGTRYTVANRPALDPETYGPRTWRKDLSLIRVKPDWPAFFKCYKQIGLGFCVPSVFWLLMLNGSYLGLYIFMASTFAIVLMSPPYLFSFNTLGYVQAGQVVVCLLFLPLLGYGTDIIIRFMSKRNSGKFKPEFRLPVMLIPAIVGVVCAVIYGESGQHPTEWHWSAPVVSYNASLFAFFGANIVGITYAVESFPQAAGPLLVVVCAGRGFISFGLSYAVLPSIAAIGYNGAMRIEGSIAGALALIAIPVYFAGPALRRLGTWILSK